MDHRSRSSSIRKDHVRHVTISSSSSSSRSRSRNRSHTRSRSLSSLSRSRSRSGSHRRHKRHRHPKRRRRSRSKSRSRSRKSRSHSYTRKDLISKTSTAYLGTNSRDPKMVASRIFIGNLPMSDVSKEDIDAIYGKYGRILGITVKPGFGFIQFEKEQEAMSAVAGERGSMLKGFQLDVKMATDGRSREEREKSPSFKGREPDGYMPPRPPPMPPHPPGIGMYRPPSQGHPIGPMHSPFFGLPIPGPFHRGPLPPPDHFRRNPFAEPFHSELFSPEFPVRHGFPLHPHAAARPPTLPSPPAVDCEIIVVEAKPRLYADSIKKRLMAAGIVTDMTVVSEVDVATELEEAARRRMMFAVIVNEQNEMHRSITVNILHGIPQEHRNMPLDDAVTLITRSYDKYLLERKERAGALPPPAHPEEFLPPNSRIQYLLNLLSDHRFLTSVELSDVIAYLEERRRLLISQEKNRPVHSQSRELESRKPADLYPPNTLENRSFSDVDERERSVQGDTFRDRLAQSGDTNRERQVHGSDLSRERLTQGANSIRDRMADVNRERLALAADFNKERCLSTEDKIQNRLAFSEDLNRDTLAIENSNLYSQAVKRERRASTERLLQAEVARCSSFDNHRHVDHDRVASVSSANQASDMSIANILGTSINFDSPSVKQALDNLMSGGPCIFKSVSNSVGQKCAEPKYPEGDSRF